MSLDTLTKNHIRQALEKATVKILTTSGFKGTGFFISHDGYILTAWHCIAEVIPLSTTIIVETSGGKVFEKVALEKDKSVQILKIR